MNFSRILLCTATLALGCSICEPFSVPFAESVAAQQVSSDEVRTRSWAYQPPAPTLRVEASSIQVGIVVRDSKGQIVTGLRPEDFSVYDDGKKQPLTQFSIETHTPLSAGPPAPQSNATQTVPQRQAQRPRYVALYFDDLNTQFGDIRHVQLAAEKFLHTGVSPNDQIALFTASGLQTVDFTTDASRILSAIRELKFHGRTIASSGCPRMTPYDAYVIANQLDITAYQAILAEAVQCNCADVANYDRNCNDQQEQLIRLQAGQMWESVREMSRDTLNTVQAVIDYLAKKPGERVFVLASSGFLTGTMGGDVDSVIDRALHAGIVINTLDAKGLYNEDPSHGRMLGESLADSPAATLRAEHEMESFNVGLASATSAMADFSLGTGGKIFHNRNDLNAGYYMLAAAPQTEYLLGFSPDKQKLNGSFHKLKVEVDTPHGANIQARPGYFAIKKDLGDASKPTSQDAIDQAVLGDKEISEIPSSANYQLRRMPAGTQELAEEFHVGVKQLPFVHDKERMAEQLGFVVALFNEKGNFVAGKEGEMTLALKQPTYDRLSKTGINATMSLPVSAGTYRLRTVIREGAKGEIVARSQTITVQ